MNLKPIIPWAWSAAWVALGLAVLAAVAEAARTWPLPFVAGFVLVLLACATAAVRGIFFDE